MEYWEEFIRYEHANSVMIAVGALLIFISTMRIIKSSLAMFLWVLMAGVGAASLSYGFEHSPYDLPALGNVSVADVTKLAPSLDMDSDVLHMLCEKVSEAKSE